MTPRSLQMLVDEWLRAADRDPATWPYTQFAYLGVLAGAAFLACPIRSRQALT